MTQALSTVEESTGHTHMQGQRESVNLDSVLSHGQGFHSVLSLPQGFQPQLQWQSTPKVDWEQWAVTAKVTVVPESISFNNSAIKTPAPSKSSPIELHQPFLAKIKAGCPAYAEDLAQGMTPKKPTGWSFNYSILVNNVAVGTLASRESADAMAAQIRQAISAMEANPSALQPTIGKHRIGAKVNHDTVVFDLPDTGVPEGSWSAAQVATAWVNNLRHIFGASPLALGETQMVDQGLGETDQVFRGTASWYGPYFHGRLTATGEIFDQHELTAAHKTLPFGTLLKVRNLLNDKTVVVRINDRGPYIGDRSLDLSYAAAQCLDSEIVGVIPYEATILEPGVPRAWQAAEAE